MSMPSRDIRRRRPDSLILRSLATWATDARLTGQTTGLRRNSGGCGAGIVGLHPAALIATDQVSGLPGQAPIERCLRFGWAGISLGARRLRCLSELRQALGMTQSLLGGGWLASHGYRPVRSPRVVMPEAVGNPMERREVRQSPAGLDPEQGVVCDPW